MAEKAAKAKPRDVASTFNKNTAGSPRRPSERNVETSPPRVTAEDRKAPDDHYQQEQVDPGSPLGQQRGPAPEAEAEAEERPRVAETSPTASVSGRSHHSVHAGRENNVYGDFAEGRAADSERRTHLRVDVADRVATVTIGDASIRLDRDDLMVARKVFERAAMVVG